VNFFAPLLPRDPILADPSSPLDARLRCGAKSWVEDGFGAPVVVYLFYLLKVVLYVGGFVLCCAPSTAHHAQLAWAMGPVAFQKAVVWSAVFEVLGLGCGSGPLTGRYLPPLGGVLHFIRRGTPKRAPWPSLPIVGGDRRGVVDVGVFVAFVALAAAVLAAPAPSRGLLAALLGAWVIMSLCDSTLFLAARSEHYAVLVACFILSDEWLMGARGVALALWTWAGVSKLNAHFPYVVSVMASNSPLVPRMLRRRLVRRYPEDLRPSGLARAMAHLGAGLELAVPFAFIMARTPTQLTVAFGLMLALHAFIIGSVPLGVPLEWNVMVVYQGFVLFGANRALSWSWPPPLTLALLLVACVAVPLAGNLGPAHVSFLPSMRYYAGNWACSAWLFRGESYRKLHASLTLPTPWVGDQLARLYPEAVGRAVLAKALAFRAMHLHGRALVALAPRAASDVDTRTWLDGELVCGMTLGWNFGDGHLHDERLVASLQRSCGFGPGELRCVMVESQPLFGDSLAYRIVDAATGPVERGQLPIVALLERQPWGEPVTPKS